MFTGGKLKVYILPKYKSTKEEVGGRYGVRGWEDGGILPT